MSRFFIHRPVFAGVIAIVIVLAGLVAAKLLAVAQYPEIAPPTVLITTSYPGASAETLTKTVAGPIEEQLSGLERLSYFSSTASSTGALSITITFEPGSNVDQAVFNVNNRVNIALPRLPDEVRRNGIIVQKRSFDILNVVTLSSPKGTRDTLFLSNYASINLVDELKRLPGLADVTVFGARDYSMRVWLNTEKMARLGVTPSDVAGALRAQNAQYAAGKIGTEPAPPGQAVVYTVTAIGRLVDPEQFGDIVVRASFNNAGPGGVLRLRDTARFVDASIREVTKTIFEAALLVLAVVFLFLQTWRATLIPMIAVPVSLIGAFAGLWAVGFTINTLTLFALVLAIGIVVDDAIVVLENVERLMRENDMAPFDAALEAMREVSGAVVAIVLVLCAVFVPVAFLGGIAGQLYRQFAVTLTFAVVISGFIALTLTPALCALLMKPGHHEARIFVPFNRGFAWVTRRFLAGVELLLRHRWISLAGFAAVLALC